jgi:hypothetical protein
MSPTGFRWFVSAVVAALVVIMLIIVRGNAAWIGRVPSPKADDRKHVEWQSAPAPVAAVASSAIQRFNILRLDRAARPASHAD